MARELITEPQERCPVCGRKFETSPYFEYWFCCYKEDHDFRGPLKDSYGRGIDRVVRRIRRRMTKEVR